MYSFIDLYLLGYFDAFEYPKYDGCSKYTHTPGVLQAITSRLCPKIHRKTNGVSQKGSSQIKVCLENKKLLERFNKFGTEMIITKSGR